MAKGTFKNINLKQRGKKAAMPVETITPKRWQIELKKTGATRVPFKSHW